MLFLITCNLVGVNLLCEFVQFAQTVTRSSEPWSRPKKARPVKYCEVSCHFDHFTNCCMCQKTQNSVKMTAKSTGSCWSATVPKYEVSSRSEMSDSDTLLKKKMLNRPPPPYAFSWATFGPVIIMQV